MPDYIYLLESRLSADQQSALRLLRETAREADTILFLVGDAVRDLTSGHAVREMEVAVHGNALKLKKKLEKLGASIWGEDEATRSLYLCFPGTVRVDVVSTHRTEYPRLGKAVIHPASIHEDLRRRDFTANSMAISLNEGSFGLLMDPLNGAADIETRTLRLASNYGFLEDPSLMIRATRYMARLNWEMDPRTRMRYEDAKNEGVIGYLTAQARSREVEQIGHEEEGLKVLQALQSEGWMKHLFPAWTPSCADEEKLNSLHELVVELLMQGVHADTSAAQMRLLTAKMLTKDLNALKKLMLRPGFVEEWTTLDAKAAAFEKVLLSKEYTSPSQSFKLFTSYDPETVLWSGFTTKNTAVKERFRLFLKVWPEARQRIPYPLMLEMRITPELAGYAELVQKIFLELIDGRLETPEDMREFLEPYSPPAPPPQPTVKRMRAKRGEGRLKQRVYEDEDEEESHDDEDEDLDSEDGDDEELNLSEEDMEAEPEEESEPEEAEEESERKTEKPAHGAKTHGAKKGATEKTPASKAKAPAAKVGKKSKESAKPPEKAKKPAEAAAETKPHGKAAHVAGKKHAEPAKAAATVHAKPAPKKAHAAPAVAKGTKATAPAKAHPKAPAKAAAKAPVKAAVKAAAKTTARAPAKSAAKVRAKAAHKPAQKPAHKAAAKPAAAKSAVKAKHAAPPKKHAEPAKKATPTAAKAAKPQAKKTAGKPAKKH